MFLHARYYDPEIGRFISPDPLISFEHPSAANPYEYGFNNPISNSDVNGMQAQGSTQYPSFEPLPEDWFSRVGGSDQASALLKGAITDVGVGNALTDFEHAGGKIEWTGDATQFYFAYGKPNADGLSERIPVININPTTLKRAGGSGTPADMAATFVHEYGHWKGLGERAACILERWTRKTFGIPNRMRSKYVADALGPTPPFSKAEREMSPSERMVLRGSATRLVNILGLAATIMSLPTIGQD